MEKVKKDIKKKELLEEEAGSAKYENWKKKEVIITSFYGIDE